VVFVNSTTNEKHSILLVDDNLHILELYKEILSGEGYQLTKATSGEMAIEALERQEFDMIITDLNMGKMSGLNVLKRAKEVHPETMVIVMTGNTDIEYAIEALRLHADDYILKPFRIHHLLKRVTHCFTLLENKKRNKMSAA
jgi:DNA-binding NtrC family response regulator